MFHAYCNRDEFDENGDICLIYPSFCARIIIVILILPFFLISLTAITDAMHNNIKMPCRIIGIQANQNDEGKQV